MKQIHLLVLCYLLFSTAAYSQTALYDSPTPDSLYLTLDQAVQRAIRENPDLKRVQLSQDLLEKQVQRAKGTGLPQVNASAGFMDNFSLPQQLLPGEIFGEEGQIPVTFGVRYGVNAGVEVTQLLYSRAYQSNLQKLDATRTTLALQELSSREDLVYNVIQAYIQYQISVEQYGILQANLRQLNTLVDVAQAQYDNGIIKKLDLDQIKVNRTNLLAELTNMETALAQQLNVIRFYLNLRMDQPLVLTDELEGSPYTPSLKDSLFLGANINYQLLSNQLALNEMDDEVIKAEYYPTVSAFAQYNYNGQGNEFNFNNDNYVDYAAGVWGLNLSIPIFNGFQTRRQLEENEIKRQQLRYDLQTLEQSTRMAFSNARHRIAQNEKLIATQQANMELAQEVYNVTRLSYQEGVAPLTELLNAETSLQEAQAQYLTALINLKLAELEHLKTSGQLAQLLHSNYNK